MKFGEFIRRDYVANNEREFLVALLRKIDDIMMKHKY